MLWLMITISVVIRGIFNVFTGLLSRSHRQWLCCVLETVEAVFLPEACNVGTQLSSASRTRRFRSTVFTPVLQCHHTSVSNVTFLMYLFKMSIFSCVHGTIFVSLTVMSLSVSVFQVRAVFEKFHLFSLNLGPALVPFIFDSAVSRPTSSGYTPKILL